MSKMELKKLPLSQLDHVGVVVADLEKAIEHFQSLGLGPFEPLKLVSLSRKNRGKPVDVTKVRNNTATARMGSGVNLELLHPIVGGPSLSIWKKFLESKGEGVHHLCWRVDDLDDAVAKMKETGFEIVTEVKFQNGGGAVYFDTGKVGNVLFELIEYPRVS